MQLDPLCILIEKRLKYSDSTLTLMSMAYLAVLAKGGETLRYHMEINIGLTFFVSASS